MGTEKKSIILEEAHVTTVRLSKSGVEKLTALVKLLNEMAVAYEAQGLTLSPTVAREAANTLVLLYTHERVILT